MWLIFGWGFVGVGLVGTLVPLLPTVPFLLMAAYCFERGSPRLHAWLLDHKTLGPPVKDWRQYGVIRWPAKLIAVSSITLSIGYALYSREHERPVQLIMILVGLSVSFFILTRKSRRS